MTNEGLLKSLFIGVGVRSPSTATRKSEVRNQKSEVFIGNTLSIVSLVTYFRHPVLGAFYVPQRFSCRRQLKLSCSLAKKLFAFLTKK